MNLSNKLISKLLRLRKKGFLKIQDKYELASKSFGNKFNSIFDPKSDSEKLYEACSQGNRFELFEVTPYGIEHPIYLRRGTSDILNYRGIFEREEYKFLANPLNQILDLGGYIGIASVYFANRFPDAQILLVEPDPDNFVLATLNCRGYKNITCLNCGVWSHSCNINQTGQVGKLGGDFGKMFSESTSAENGTAISAKSIIELMTIAKFDRLDFCKIDIEGSEKVLFDATDAYVWLDKCKIVSCEFHDRMVEGCTDSGHKALESAGFKSHRNGEYDYFVKNSI
ncbi:FkbM family methyltransferase [Synechococcus sp. AH-551-G15]|nr:FkbM family methyltransferase [Synechococcus sp. AH-551-G15]